jgi:spore germination protein GerM
MRASVNALIDGPASENFERAFPEETRIIGIRREGELGIVVFSKEFRFENENLEMLAISTVEKTLLQINSIKKVKITVEGK